MVREARFSLPKEFGFEIPELRDDLMDDLDVLLPEPDTHPHKDQRDKKRKQIRKQHHLRKRAS